MDIKTAENSMNRTNLSTLMQSIRQKALTYITLEDSDWEPTPDDIEAVVSFFSSADKKDFG